MFTIKKIFSIFLFLLISISIKAQRVVEAHISDNLVLNITAENSTIQWQQSADGITWENIESATTAREELIIETIPYHYRAQITAQNCENFYYSEVITITDDDTTAPTFSIVKTTDAIEGVSDATFTISIVGGVPNITGAPITGSITLTGTATSGIDYTDLTSFAIPNGDTSVVVTIPVLNDDEVEDPETIIATISAPSIGSVSAINFDTATITDAVTIEGELWSNPATWGTAGKPVAGQQVTIPEGKRILLDENTPPLGGLTIAGSLEFLEQDLELTSDWIMVNQGTLRIGYEQQLFRHKATITLTGDDMNQSMMGMGTRGIMVMGGSLELHGASPNVAWTKISKHVLTGDTTIELVDQVNWKIGDEIILGPTDYYEAANGTSVTQKMRIVSINGNEITVDQPINAFHWGVLQYATTTGMSLSSVNLLVPPVADTSSEKTPLILDERAPVGNLTRNIVIQAPDDALWQNEGFGAHVMMMMLSSNAHVEGVEFRRAGQSGRLGRYPFHWHRLSYSGSETLGDANGHYLRNATINSSMNRGIVIHGTNGLLIQNNIVYDVRGHAVFTEDAVERRNTLDGNLVLHVRNPPEGRALKLHETGERGSSAFWISNPDNIVTNNTAADSRSHGFWLAFPEQPMGPNAGVLGSDGRILSPAHLLFGVFDNNTTHSNRLEGIMFDLMEIDNEGNLGAMEYRSTIDGHMPEWPFPTQRRFSLTRYKTWKNGNSGIWNRNVWGDNLEAVNADNAGRNFAGAGTEGNIERCLVIGTSLNDMMNGTGRPPVYDTMGDNTPTAFATYHSTFDIKNNIAINFPMEANKRSGIFATEDYYTRPVEKGQIRNTNNMMIASHPGVKLRSEYAHFTLASAVWDPYGIWGPAEQYFVYDDPFLTYGLTKTIVQPGPEVGGVSVPGPFYGFLAFTLNDANEPWADIMAIHVERLDQNRNEIATWSVAGTYHGELLDHMRDFAAHPSGIYELTFPEETSDPVSFEMGVENMLTSDDQVLVGIQFEGTVSPVVEMMAYDHPLYQYEELASFDAVRNSQEGTYWQDSANNRIWVKIVGGHWSFYTDNNDDAEPDERLYETTRLRISAP